MKVIELDFVSTYFPDKIFHFSECTSTSDELRAWLNNEGEPVIFLADHQTDGRGRKDKIWQSQPKENLLVTIPIFFPKPLPSFITLILGLALKESLSFFLVKNASIKWPNDILIGGKKVAGILAETLPQSREGVCCVLAGIGVNINNSSFSPELSKKATSLFITTGATFLPLDLLKVFLKNLEKKLLKLELDGFFEFKALWEESSSSLGRLIAYPIEKKREASLPRNEWTGRARILGIDYDGALVIQKEEGGVEKLFSEEVEYLDAFYD